MLTRDLGIGTVAETMGRMENRELVRWRLLYEAEAKERQKQQETLGSRTKARRR